MRSVKPPSSVKALACAAICRSSSAQATPIRTSAALAAISEYVDEMDGMDFLDGMDTFQ